MQYNINTTSFCFKAFEASRIVSLLRFSDLRPAFEIFHSRTSSCRAEISENAAAKVGN